VAQALLVFDTGQRVLLAIPGSAVLGRNPVAAGRDQIVRIEDPDFTVSKTHLRLDADAHGLSVTDLGSTNGSGIVAAPGQELPLAAGETRAVPHGTTIRLGDRTVVSAFTHQAGG
jgi:pSer/pThr/pTyr-binding forkhead associated (FHA) protein